MGDYCQICENKDDKNGNSTEFFKRYIDIRGKSVEINIALHRSCVDEGKDILLEYSN